MKDLGTLLVAAVLIGGSFFGLQYWKARTAPPPEPEPAAGPAVALSRPEGLPGAARKEEPQAPPEGSLGMVKLPEDYSGVAVRGPMANSRPEPPLVYDGDRGPARAGTRLIRSKAQWDALWKEVGGHDMPVVEFDRYIGLAIFAGQRPAGTKVAVLEAKKGSKGFAVLWKAAAPKTPEPGTANPFKVLLFPLQAAAPTAKEVR
ncbi:MAG: hypothetical protein HY928_06060 [Elusimicrobia bacterium]|nr:hypothetical protein [Elusimicrobiota bacterium]